MQSKVAEKNCFFFFGTHFHISYSVTPLFFFFFVLKSKLQSRSLNNNNNDDDNNNKKKNINILIYIEAKEIFFLFSSSHLPNFFLSSIQFTQDLSSVHFKKRYFIFFCTFFFFPSKKTKSNNNSIKKTINFFHFYT